MIKKRIAIITAAAMIAVARKMFDGRDKDQRSLGNILGSLFKSILPHFILLMALITD